MLSFFWSIDTARLLWKQVHSDDATIRAWARAGWRRKLLDALRFDLKRFSWAMSGRYCCTMHTGEKVDRRYPLSKCCPDCWEDVVGFKADLSARHADNLTHNL